MEDMEGLPSRRDETSLSRRRYLRLGGLVGLTSLSGCTRDVVEEFPQNTKWPLSETVPELPVHERSEVLEEGVLSMSDVDVQTVDDFTSALKEEGIDVRAVEETHEVLSVEYVSQVSASEGTYHDIATIAGVYAVLVENGYDVYALALTIHPEDASSYGSWTVKTRVAKRYNAGELTAAEYGELVATTLESTRSPPEVGVKPDK